MSSRAVAASHGGPSGVGFIVSVEGGCETMKPEDAKGPFAKVPFVSVWGDFSVGAKDTVNGDTRRNGCGNAAKLIADAGGKGSLLMLPDAGIKGNSHMLMMDKNNLEIAGTLRKWIGENAGNR